MSTRGGKQEHTRTRKSIHRMYINNKYALIFLYTNKSSKIQLNRTLPHHRFSWY